MLRNLGICVNMPVEFKCYNRCSRVLCDLIAYRVCLFVETDPIAHPGIKIVIIAFLMFKLEMHQHKVEIKEDIWRL